MNRKGKTTIKDVLIVVGLGFGLLFCSFIFFLIFHTWIEGIEFPWNILVTLGGGALVIVLLLILGLHACKSQNLKDPFSPRTLNQLERFDNFVRKRRQNRRLRKYASISFWR